MTAKSKRDVSTGKPVESGPSEAAAKADETARIDTLEAVTQQLKEALAHDAEVMASLGTRLDDLARMVVQLSQYMGYNPEDPGTPFKAELEELAATVADLKVKVEGRNKSAAVKRNMTDEDALSVLTGEFKDLSHKDAGEQVGLTYAQVYSCRLEYTFKHVHKDLRESGWKNPWADKK